VCEALTPGVNRATHTKKNHVKDDFLGLQGLTENLVLFFRAPCIFTVLNKVYLPHVDI